MKTYTTFRILENWKQMVKENVLLDTHWTTDIGIQHETRDVISGVSAVVID